ncbi:FMN-linked oxidoreductase [Laetiporus sulphureus 93-53]|uniref:FMN-linked oxidoreductase n=1 Tax=Laetiporus sulphureus 93-53 TaxID=1314785 RepID=A0A165E3Z3_9APHY|nr:FMN-linked oxidoreductase [Laetiporus sulphureus 93-53]KZT06204.1 FMN-linked oxidoreductase [Laetiporus sulphureus 93-53]
MVQIHTLAIDPPLLNASCMWASELSQLRELYNSPFTGAVTTRTAILDGYKENESNQFVFSADKLTTLNSFGYSPHPLSQYIEWVFTVLTSSEAAPTRAAPKPIIMSVTASNPIDLAQVITDVQSLRERLRTASFPSPIVDPATLVAIELNTSCPNIPSAPPPSYHLPSLRPLLAVLASAAHADPSFTIGLKLPPYPDVTRAKDVLDCLAEYTSSGSRSPFAFLTCTNTLGGSVLFSDQVDGGVGAHGTPAFALPPALGGLGGVQLHPLALGTVLSFSRALAAHADPALRAIKIIGVGGVTDRAAAKRMRAAGASAVACATLLGKEGVRAFEILSEPAEEKA